MTKKVLLNGTHAYEGFISDDDKDSLLSWVENNIHENGFWPSLNHANVILMRIRLLGGCAIYQEVTH